ncbi:MAG: hypothetical protein AAGD86_10555 [Pseudomonadota bacterium]
MTILTGVLLGTSFSIFFGLGVVALIFAILAPDHPRLEAEIRPLAESFLLFMALTVVCAVSFIGAARQRRWRWLAQGAMWLGVAAAVSYYLQ